MPNSNAHAGLNQHADTTDAALDRIAIAVAAKLKATGTLDDIRKSDHIAKYHDANRKLVAAVLRWNLPGGKVVRPVQLAADGKFALGAPSTWPLYNLVGLLHAELSKPVVVVEGEPCADCGNRIFGDIAIFITSAQGANNAHKTDWSPVRGREIYVWPDADDAGKQYAKAVADLAHRAGAKCVKILDPAAIAGRSVESGWDIVDAIRECENDAAKLAALRARLLDAMQSATEWRPVSEAEQWHFDFHFRDTDDHEIGIITVIASRRGTLSSRTLLAAAKFSVFSLVSRHKIVEKAVSNLVSMAGELGIDANTLAALQERLKKELTRRLEEHALKANLRAAVPEKQDDAEQLVQTIEPWPEPIGLGQVLDDVVKLLKDYVVFERDSDAKLVALWIALTYCFEKFDHLPLLIITSGTWRCGKSRLLSLVSWLCQRPFDVSAASVAAIFRVGELYKPTLLLDEADNARLDDHDLACVFNAGADREHASVVRAEPVGDTFMPTKFNVFFPKALAGINIECYIRGSTLDRSLVIRLNRATAPYMPRAAVKPVAAQLARKLCRAIADSELRNDYSLLPDWLVQRDADMMLPLVSIATVAGERWQTEVTDAIRQYLGAVAEDKLHPTERLLRDIVDVCEREGLDEVSAEDLARRLNEGGYDWDEKRGGRGITATWIGRSLRSVGVLPHKTNRKRLYNVKQIRDVAERYGVLAINRLANLPNLPHLPHESLDLGEPKEEVADWECFTTADGIDVSANLGGDQELGGRLAGLAGYADINREQNATDVGAATERGPNDTAEPLPGGTAPPQLNTDWQFLERAELDNLVSQLTPELRKRYWELHADYRVRHYPYIDARRWAWWELQRELNSRERPGSG